MARGSLLLLAVTALAATAHAAHNAQLSLLSPKGLRISIPDVPGATLVAIHYSINSPLSGVQAGRWNYDIRSKSGGQWVHENRHVTVNRGDVVNYWIYMLVNGRGWQVMDQRWTASGGSSAPAVAPVQPVRPSGGSSSGGASAGDQTWNGRTLKLVVDDEFNGQLDTGIWEHENSLWGGGNWEFQAYTNVPETSFTRGGALYIKPIPTTAKYGDSWLTSGNWDVKKMYGYCTNSAAYGCLRDGHNGFLNPVMSAKLRSRKGIKYGKVEIVAKMPRGDWLWSALWMLPNFGSRNGQGAYGAWPMSGEIDIMESRGNRNYGNLGVDHMGSTLHWGTAGNDRYTMTAAEKKASSKTLADGYHRYTLLWDENGMQFSLDNQQVAKFNTPSQGFFRWGNLPGGNIWGSSKNAPFDKEFYLILNVAVGGVNGYFPDSVPNGDGRKPWSNQDHNAPQKFWNGRGQWQPTWKGDDAAMIVDSVRMWQLQ